MTRIDFAALRDSVRAQEIADQVGPRVSIHANITNYSSSRRVRASIHVDDDAYILVGHLGADGVVRIVFPLDPQDNGFVRGNRSYDIPEFFAGFEDRFRYRAVYDLRTSTFSPARYDSYDGGTGYVFVIAAWRPMRFDRFSDGDRFQSFEVADEMYMRDPRPAIYELATLLTGENREAYTVQFARYYNTSYTPILVGSFNASYCLGNEPFGYGFSSFGGLGYGGFGYLNAGGFYGSSRYGSGYGYGYNSLCGGRSYYRPTQQFAQTPFIPSARPSNPLPGAVMPGELPRPRGTPIQEPVKPSPGTTSPEYRRRGLVTVDDGSDAGARPAPRAPAGREHVDPTRERPSIQEMINRRRGENIAPTAQTGPPEPPPRERTLGRNPTGSTPPDLDQPTRARPRPEQRAEPVNEPRSAPRSQPQAEPVTARPSPPPARVEPRVESRPEPRAESKPEPRAETKPEVRSAPPTPPPAVRPITP